jgi:hypothetical protein
VVGGKIPYAIGLKDDSPFVFAGLWEDWKDPATWEWLHMGTIIAVNQTSSWLKSTLELLTGLLRRHRSRGLYRFNLFRKGFGGNSRPRGPAEPIDVKCHDKTVSRYGENQRTCQCSIFLMFVVHNFSPHHSGCEQFSCESD